MTSTESPAETMRRAAKRMRERAEHAAPSPWKQNDTEVIDGDQETVVDGLNPANAEHIADMHPGVAHAVANWLQLAAADYAVHGKDAAGHWAYALDVARAYLGETPAATGGQ